MLESERESAGRSGRSLRWWVVTLATLGMVALTFSLGRWQLARAQYKTERAASIEARARAPSLPVQELLSGSDLAHLVHRRVLVQGHWLADRTVYLDNRPMAGRQGLWVLTPLQLEGHAQVLWVQRGWIARNFQDRRQLNPLDTPQGLVSLEGRLALTPGQLYQLGPEEGGPIRQNLDLAQYRAESGLPLLSALLIQTGQPSEGLLRDWDPPESGVHKHQGYAFQWFSLSALLVLLYAWFQWIAPYRRKLSAPRS